MSFSGSSNWFRLFCAMPAGSDLERLVWQVGNPTALQFDEMREVLYRRGKSAAAVEDLLRSVFHPVTAPVMREGSFVGGYR